MVEIDVDERPRVEDALADHSPVANTSPLGPGLTVSFAEQARSIQGLDRLTSRHGWYIAQIDTGHDDLIVHIMPLTKRDA